MNFRIAFVIFLFAILSCKQEQKPAMFYIDQQWIEVHFRKNMTTKELVDIRDRLMPLGVIVNYLTIKRDSLQNITLFQIDVQDGKGKIARSRTEFLDEIPYGIRIHRGDISDEGFKVGHLYTKRPE